MFYALLEEERPRLFKVEPEVRLSKEPLVADFILIRRLAQGDVSDAGVLRGLWPHIRTLALVEFKSVSRPVRQGDLTKLLGYGGQYATLKRRRLKTKEDLVLVLVTAKPSSALNNELTFLGATLGASVGGYAPISGLCFPAWAVFLDEVSTAERDELVGSFGHIERNDPTVRQWWLSHLWSGEKIMTHANIENLEGYEEMVAKVLAGMPLDLRLKGLTTKERLHGVEPEEILSHVMPEDLIRGSSREQRQRLKKLLDDEE